MKTQKQTYCSPQAEVTEFRMEMNCMSPAFNSVIEELSGGSEEYDDWN